MSQPESTPSGLGQVAVRDVIYFDFDKAASLLSQVDEGFLREVQSSLEDSRERRTRGGLDARVASLESETAHTERELRLETRVVYHDLLARLETTLFDLGAAVDPSARPRTIRRGNPSLATRSPLRSR